MYGYVLIFRFKEFFLVLRILERVTHSILSYVFAFVLHFGTCEKHLSLYLLHGNRGVNVSLKFNQCRSQYFS